MAEQLGKYSLTKLLATGGMAEIWLARQRGVHGFEKLVVIKRILPHLARNSAFVTMFLDEARLAAQLAHPNIVQIYELGRVNDAYFISMEFIHGENLRTVFRAANKRGSGLGFDLPAKVISHACEGLYYAHTKTDVTGKPMGVVHRDVSPQNILVSFDGQTKVVDFGIAKAASQFEETRTGILKGKTAYMSPEQCRADKIDARSDIFSMGIVLWELTTGKRLYKQSSDLLIMRALCDEHVPLPSSAGSDIPEELESIIMKAMAKDPNDRFKNCHEMHLALESYLRKRNVHLSPVEIAKEMQTLFAAKLEAWKDVLDNLYDDEDLEAQLFSDLSGLLDTKTPSSRHAITPYEDASGAKPVVILPDEEPSETNHLPLAPKPLAGPSLSQDSEFIHDEERSKDSGLSPIIWAPLLFLTLILAAWGGYSLKQSTEDTTSQDLQPLVEIEAGTLQIDSVPSIALVYVNNANSGVTPLTIRDLPKERDHTIRIEKPGFESWSTEVRFEEFERRKRLSAQLDPLREVIPDALLEIRTEPAEAAVFIDGQLTPGTTPMTLDIQPEDLGKHVSIEIEGFEPEERVLDLEPGSRTRWDLVLRSTPESPTTGIRRPTTRSGGTKASKVSSRTGTISINARPWCNLRLDGEIIGQTPLLRFEVSAGQQRIICENPQLGATKELTLNVPAGGHVRETVSFEMGRLDVRVRPWAEVLVNGRSLGTTPFEPQLLPAGQHKVVLENPSFRFRKEYRVTIRPNETHVIRENLVD